ncbi:unnamed protein product [Adineta ricciae]|uniref:Uncharacterized protein n=1 Tax=Adineta ricciae TaxID=249248 RepID=A0A815E7A8_ADIRI|nr:unnamed protein product [Adineta ricciae]CAF1530299.1 unnamed protein product [Adineta ricciae]
MSLFQLAHANELLDGEGWEYEIKYYFLRARDLHDAHVFVTLNGHEITPKFYPDAEYDLPEIYQIHAKQVAEERSLEEYERMNEECSQGEHFWHSIKEIDPQKYDGKVIEINADCGQVFQLSIQFDTPCKNELTDQNIYKYNQYHMEQKKNIYQLRAQNEEFILKFFLENLEKFDLDFQKLTVEPENMKTWKDFQEFSENQTKCLDNHHTHGEFIVLKLEKLNEPIKIIHCND